MISSWKVSLKESPVLEGHQSPLLKGLLALVVDDDPDTTDLFAVMLELYGAEVIVAASSCEALEAMKQCRPDILISDIRMEEEDGYDLICKVRTLDAEAEEKIPAIAVTGLAREEDRIRALSAGFQRHLSKPIDLHELVTVVAELAKRD